MTSYIFQFFSILLFQFSPSVALFVCLAQFPSSDILILSSFLLLMYLPPATFSLQKKNSFVSFKRFSKAQSMEGGEFEVRERWERRNKNIGRNLCFKTP